MKSLVACFLSLFATAATAHVIISPKSAVSGSTVKLTLRIGHGCDDDPTTKFTVTIPDGVTGVKPTDRPGWTTEASQHAVAWSRTPKADTAKDEFEISVTLPSTPQALDFPVTQDCGKKSVKWNETGGSHPAPVLQVTAP